MASLPPTVFVLASLFPSASQYDAYVFMTESGALVSGEVSMLPEEPTRVMTFDARDPLPEPVARELVSHMSGVTSEDAAYLREWMGERRLQAILWTSAVHYLVQMNRENLAFAAAERRFIDAERILTLYEGKDGKRSLFWIGNNDASVQVFLTRGDETRELRHGKPLRLQPGDVFTYGDLSGEFLVDANGAHFYHTDTPPSVRDHERTQVVRHPNEG